VLVTPIQSETQDGVWIGRTRFKKLVCGTQYSASVASANSFGFSPFEEAYNFNTVDIGTAGSSKIKSNNLIFYRIIYAVSGLIIIHLLFKHCYNSVLSYNPIASPNVSNKIGMRILT
jgi:hypothetical protein